NTLSLLAGLVVSRKQSEESFHASRRTRRHSRLPRGGLFGPRLREWSGGQGRGKGRWRGQRRRGREWSGRRRHRRKGERRRSGFLRRFRFRWWRSVQPRRHGFHGRRAK